MAEVVVQRGGKATSAVLDFNAEHEPLDKERRCSCEELEARDMPARRRSFHRQLAHDNAPSSGVIRLGVFCGVRVFSGVLDVR